ncbi:hypothetical protein EVAR_43615_1 [Eumeta japonica]|uniref:Uncharacterized protein n=1 Tax=Eumeta variegata TaxID=151549 RepID=A0A4C1XHI7_EUMVA|nr:hypothetical protein EVAR_43615_1 [Eumeta japonica]
MTAYEIYLPESFHCPHVLLGRERSANWRGRGKGVAELAAARQLRDLRRRLAEPVSAELKSTLNDDCVPLHAG